MTRLVCDRCRVTAKDELPSGWKHIQKIDLCPECAKKFDQFMKNDIELYGDDAWKTIPQWTEDVLIKSSPIWFHNEEPLFSPLQVKRALQMALGVYDDSR